MYDFDSAVDVLELLANHLENWEPDRFTKATIVTFVRKAAEIIAEDGHGPDREESYREQLRLCREHGMLCLESYRRYRPQTAAADKLPEISGFCRGKRGCCSTDRTGPNR